jgi:predicted dehydrogenase
MVGLTHDHAYGFLAGLANRQDAQLAGIIETNPVLIERYSQKFHLDPGLFFPSLEALLAKTNISAVATFTSTYEHAHVVEKCAALGVGVVMMEKPLAVNLGEARKIEAAAKKSGMQIIVNYETTWYPGNQLAYTMVHDEDKIGAPWRMIFHTGHQGPKEIGCSTNFLAWLTDPVLNGGGALNDFGCYGADLATWFMDGQAPTSVTAVTQHLKPEIYPKVEDDATIVLTYPKADVIIQASWNWPYNRKDMEIYGKTGCVLVPVPNLMRVRTAAVPAETEVVPPAITGAHADSVSYLSAVVRKEIQPGDLSSLEVNMVVVKILDAAHQSARTGKRVDL